MGWYIFFDFDETIFNHEDYQQFWANVLEQKLGVDSRPYVDTFSTFHDKRGVHGLYRHKQHALRTTGHEWSFISGVATDEVRQGEHHFCHNDAHAAIARAVATGAEVRILTYGREAYQRFKISLCDEVARLPVHVVTEDKGDFLARYFGGEHQHGVLIDDKSPQDISLPPNWQHVWINRNGQPMPDEARCIEVDNLDFSYIELVAGFADTIHASA